MSMNRIQPYFADAATEPSQPAVAIEAGRFHVPAADSSHWMFVPLHYEQNYAYPLIVWLHGPNDDQRQLKRIMPFVSMRNYVAVSPRGTLAGKRRAGQTGYCWSQDPDHILLAEQRVLDAIGEVRSQLNVASHRIFVAGYGCGGTMAMRLALNLPDLFAGALSLAGEFPRGQNPLAQLTKARQLKLLLASGRDSRRYPSDQVCRDLRLIYSAGMSISLRQYPCGDDLTTQMLSDVDRWVMEQISGSTCRNEDSAQPQPGSNLD